MRLLVPALALALAAVAAPALAGTAEEIAAKGMVLTLGEMELDFAFTPDGAFTAMGGAMTGKWRIDAGKLCLTGDDGQENCLDLPADKKSGDKFDIDSPLGPLPARIK